MDRALNTRGPSHEERGIATANGFVAIVFGLALMAGGAWILWRSLAGGFPAWGMFAVGILVLLLARPDTRLPVHAAAQRSRDPAALRRVQGHDPRARACALRIRSTRARRSRFARAILTAKAQGQRQARQPDRDRGRHRLAGRGHGEGRLRCRRLRALRPDAERIRLRHLATSFAYDAEDRPATTREPTLRGSADVVARALVRELQARLDAGRRRRRRSAAHAPRLRARNRAGHAAPAAGRGHDRRAQKDRARRRVHGRDGAEPSFRPRRWSTSMTSARRRW